MRSLSAIQALEKKLRPFSALLSNKTTACSVFVFSLLGENYSDVIGWNTWVLNVLTLLALSATFKYKLLPTARMASPDSLQ